MGTAPLNPLYLFTQVLNGSGTGEPAEMQPSAWPAEFV